MRGVEATASGLGFFGAGFGFEGGTGEMPEIFGSGSGLASAGFASDAAAAVVSVLPSPDFSPGSAFLPSTSAVVAAISSRAGMTSPSSAGSGSLTGCVGVGFLPRPGLDSETLRSRTVGSGTGCKSAPSAAWSTSSCNFFACFCSSFARRCSACSSGLASAPARALRSHKARTQGPNWKLVRNSKLTRSRAP